MKRLLPVLALSALAGCVSQKQYDSIRTELDATQVELEERNAQLAEEAKRAGRAQAQEDALKLALRSEKEKTAETEQRLVALHKEIASALKDKARLKASVDELANALTEAHRRKEEGEARLREFKALVERLRGLMSNGKVKVRVVDGRVVVVLPSDVLFASGAATLSEEGKSAVTTVAGVLAGLPGRRFQVEGHTDSSPIHTRQFPSNWELSAARAIHVVRTMTAAGMPPGRASAGAFAATRPVASNATPEGRSLNRRIDITLVPDLSTLPGMDDVKRAAPGGAQDSLEGAEEEAAAAEPEPEPEEPAAPARGKPGERAGGKRASPAQERRPAGDAPDDGAEAGN